MRLERIKVPWIKTHLLNNQHTFEYTANTFSLRVCEIFSKLFMAFQSRRIVYYLVLPYQDSIIASNKI